jgi:hypothetical protein
VEGPTSHGRVACPAFRRHSACRGKLFEHIQADRTAAVRIHECEHLTKLYVRNDNSLLSFIAMRTPQSTSEPLKVETVSAAVLVEQPLNSSLTQRGRQPLQPLPEALKFAFPNSLHQVIDKDTAVAVSIQMANDDGDLPVIQVHIQRAQPKL